MLTVGFFGGWLSDKESGLPMEDMKETWVRSLGQEDPLKEEMAPQSSLPAWRIPWTEEPGGLQSMWSQKDCTAERLSTHMLKVKNISC